MPDRAAAMSLLTDAHVGLLERGLDVELYDSGIVAPGANGVVVANACKDGRLRIVAALVFDGHQHVVPPGLDDSIVTPGKPMARLDRVVSAIATRLRARLDALAACPHWADNQGFCHVCGACVNPAGHTPDDCPTCKAAVVVQGRTDTAFVDNYERELDTAAE